MIISAFSVNTEVDLSLVSFLKIKTKEVQYFCFGIKMDFVKKNEFNIFLRSVIDFSKMTQFIN